jgi:hypothetical protein
MMLRGSCLCGQVHFKVNGAATSVKLEQHIFVAHKGDYYEITDGLSQKAQ